MSLFQLGWGHRSLPELPGRCACLQVSHSPAPAGPPSWPVQLKLGMETQGCTATATMLQLECKNKPQALPQLSQQQV